MSVIIDRNLPSFKLKEIAGPLTNEAKRFYTDPHCGRCHQSIASDAVWMTAFVVTTRSSFEFEVFLHEVCLSDIVLSGEVVGG